MSKSFIQLARDRYSVRKYSDKPVEPEILRQILETGAVSPTAHNSQPQRIKVITEPEELKKLDQCTVCRFGAPAALIICYDKDVCWKRDFDGAPSGEVDASIVTTQLMYAAHDLGLGTCWVMFFDPAKTREVFKLPDNIIPVAILPLGYPAEDAAPSPRHLQRVPLEETLI
ncbi:MAG: nitroreductase family protein [Oscillospiraceae bacterium]|jgi:nitroreductase|nr:nitroreductase family protein [Oscillospiraceae bacterium]